MFTFLLLSVLGGGAWCFVVHRVTVCTNLMCVCVCVFESIIFIIWSVLFLDYKVKFKQSPHSYLKVSFVYVELQKSFVTKLHKSAWTHFGGILHFFFFVFRFECFFKDLSCFSSNIPGYFFLSFNLYMFFQTIMLCRTCQIK